MKKIITWMIIPVLLLVLVIPKGAHAYTHPHYQNQAQINYLYTLIAQLQAQLNALTGVADGSIGTNYVSVQTKGVSANNREKIEFDGRVTFKRDGDARAWFEYGQTQAMSYSTVSIELSNRDDGDVVNYSISVPDLDTNRVYYYRAVAEGQDGRYAEGVVKSFRYEGRNDYNNNNNNRNDDTPDVTTDEADDIDTDSATLQGEVDMNDFEDGLAFFVFGEDEDQVDDASGENTYRDITNDGLDLRKVQVASSFDDNRSFELTVTGLNEDTEHFFRMCVQYEDEDNDETLTCGDVESFETDRN